MNRLVFIPIALLLAACATSTPEAPTPGPNAPATTLATPSIPAGDSKPTIPSGTAPAATPAVPLLPTPLFAIDLGQIARIERDGATRDLITAERVQLPGVRPIAEFAVSTQNMLAYVVGDREADRLQLIDARGEGLQTLYSEAGHELSDLLFTPNGETLLFRLLNNRDPDAMATGLYSIPSAGGSISLVQADDPVEDPVNPARSVSGYVPLAFSPDGAQILVEVQSTFYEDCTLGVMPAEGGEVRRVALPEGEQVYCGEAAWTADGDGVLFLAGPVEGIEAGPRLWRADTTMGNAQQLAEGFARAPIGLPGGATRFVQVEVSRDAAGTPTSVTYRPVELAAAGGELVGVGDTFSEPLEEALWAPDGSGIVVAVSTEEQPAVLRWLPMGGEVVELPTSDDGARGVAWGVE